LIGAVCWIAGFFAVIVTGAWPPSLRAWVMSAQRVGLRFNAYAYLLTDQYPPFTTA
jgi:predicted membrane metal-binding protein